MDHDHLFHHEKWRKNGLFLRMKMRPKWDLFSPQNGTKIVDQDEQPKIYEFYPKIGILWPKYHFNHGKSRIYFENGIFGKSWFFDLDAYFTPFMHRLRPWSGWLCGSKEYTHVTYTHLVLSDSNVHLSFWLKCSVSRGGGST